MRAQVAATAFKAWAQENNLLGNEFPVALEAVGDARDNLFDALRITSQAESILRSRHLLAVGFNEAEQKIIALTSRKVTLQELRTLPQSIDDNISVTYLHAGLAQAAVPSSGMPHAPYYIATNGQYACGSSIHPARFIGAGTMGCLVRDGDGTLYGLTNNHVSGLCNYSRGGEKIIAPGHPDITAGGTDPFTIGYHERALPMVPGVPDNVDVSENQDAAILEIADPNLVSSMQGVYFDTPASVVPLQPGLMVEKVGRTSGHTNGQVICQLVGAFAVNYNVPSVGAQVAYFDPVFIVKGAGRPFSEPGDSGSLVTTELGGVRRAVGLVFAGDQQGLSYILPIDRILTTLGVNLESGHNV